MTTYGVGCGPQGTGVYAGITKEVATWIRSVASGTQDSDCDKESLCEDCGLEQPNNKEEEVGEEELNEEKTENDLVSLIEEVGMQSEEQEKPGKKADDYGSDYEIETENPKSIPKNTLDEVGEASTVISETSSTKTTNFLPNETEKTNLDPIEAEAHLLELLSEYAHNGYDHYDDYEYYYYDDEIR